MTARSMAWGLLCGLALVALALLWSASGSDPRASDVAAGHAPERSGRSTPIDPERVPDTPADPRPGELVVAIRDAAGHPARGTIVWSSGAAGSIPAGAWNLGDANRAEAPAGTARIVVRAGRWTWLQALREDPRSSSRHVLVPPFAGQRRVLVDLDADPGVLHVFVRSEDLAEPTAGVRVHLARRDASGPDGLIPVGSELAGPGGHVGFSGLEAGHYLVYAAGSTPREGEPWVARVSMGPHLPPEQVVAIAERGETREMTLLVQAAFDRGRQALAPRLFLRRRAPRDGDLIPVGQVLRPGTQEHRVRVSPGSYEVGVLPLDLRVSPARTVVRVGEQGGHAAIRIGESHIETVVNLTGLERVHLPVRVTALVPGDVQSDHGQALFMGPPTWHRSTQIVRHAGEPVRLVATGRVRAFRSRDVVEFRGGSQDVTMVPAVKLVIEWIPGPSWPAGAVTAYLDCGGEVLAVALVPRLIPRDGWRVPGLAGSVVAPVGQAGLEVRVENAMQWRRSLRLVDEEPVVRVLVDSGE